MSERWTRAETLDAETIIDTEVTIRPSDQGTVTIDIELVRRFLREAGYEQVIA